jgi:hypothetical protein
LASEKKKDKKSLAVWETPFSGWPQKIFDVFAKIDAFLDVLNFFYADAVPSWPCLLLAIGGMGQRQETK